MVSWQSLNHCKSVRVSAKAIERERISHDAIEFVRRAVMRFFGEFMRAFDVPLEIETESREIRGDRRLVGRGFVQALEKIVKFPCVIIAAIKPAKRVQRLASQMWIF